MNPLAIYHLISGAVMLACLVVALFFYRFWKKTHDRLFGLFALSFVVMGAERLVLVFYETPNEASPFVYLLRLSAFLIIIAAIVDKNRAKR